MRVRHSKSCSVYFFSLRALTRPFICICADPCVAQDAIKKLTQQELPDFYNITLERPRDDPDGYDVLFVEAAFMVRHVIDRDIAMGL